MNTLITQTQPTADEALAIEIKARKEGIALLHQRHLNILKNHSNFIFNNPNGTPEQVIAAMGSDASDWLSYLDAIAVHVSQIGDKPVSYIPDGASYTANKDGTVSVSVPIAASPESETQPLPAPEP